MAASNVPGMPSTFVAGYHDEDAVRKMEYRPLGATGMSVSVLSYGASALGSVYGETKEEESIAVVLAAVKAGVNLIDTAAWYGHGKSEAVLGKALRRVPRKAYYISSKVGRYAPAADAQFDFTAERVTASVDESLERLGLACIDIMQVHDPEFAADWRMIVEETLPALEACRAAGKIRYIGMTGYPLPLQQRIIEAAEAAGITVHTSLAYCHYSLNDRTLVDNGYLEWANRRGLGLINASPLSMGLLTKRGPPDWHPATEKQKRVCALAAATADGAGQNISKLALQFTLAHPDIPTTLVSTASVERLRQNLAWAVSSRSSEEVAFTDHLLDTVFVELGDAVQWTDLEPARYWANLGRVALQAGVFRNRVTMEHQRYVAVSTPVGSPPAVPAPRAAPIARRDDLLPVTPDSPWPVAAIVAAAVAGVVAGFVMGRQ